MFFDNWFKKIELQPWFGDAEAALQRGDQRWLSGVWGASRSLIAAALVRKTRRPLVVVVPHEEDALAVYEELRVFLQGMHALDGGADVDRQIKYPTVLDPGEDPLVYFPASEYSVLDAVNREHGRSLERILILRRLAQGEPLVMVTSLAAVTQKLCAPEALAGLEFKLEKGQDYSMEKLVRQLIDLGYSQEHAVEEPGQFARRGGIVDVATPNTDEPVRLEFFGDELVSLRNFDPISQRRRGELESIEVLPFQELLVDEGIRAEGMRRLDQSALSPSALRVWKERLGNQSNFGGQDWLIPFFYPEVTLFDYLDCFTEKPFLLLDQPQRLRDRLEEIAVESARIESRRSEQGVLFPPVELLLTSWDQWIKKASAFPAIYTSLLAHSLPELKNIPANDLSFKSLQFHQGDMGRFYDEMLVWGGRNQQVLMACQSEGDQERVAELMREKEIPTVFLNSKDQAGPLEPGTLGLCLARIDKGFDARELGLVLVSDQELFHRQKIAKPRVYRHRYKGLKGSRSIESFAELKQGEYAVHIDHGIAIFRGVKRMNVDGLEKDFVCLEYRDKEKLYVPVDQVNLVQKYLGGEENPRMHKLGGQSWANARKKVEKDVAEMAEELLNLYARRQVAKKDGLGSDSNWQRSFENSFPFNETPDQLKAIAEVKADMESAKPSDRLVCGDVGFGKTEVAMRAAFKAVMGGTQVAVLVPTTILAQQHFVNFTERMGDYPVKIAMLSRFRKASEIRTSIQQLSEGSLDLVIGTHRLLGKDVQFKKLGLIIVDEEQRFGVSHKERLKRFRSHVDVISMSATPIPRTLHLSLSGIRDMSVIETPPLDRLPIRTYVLEENTDMARDAIMAELARQGQVFYVHNRVKNIEQEAERLRQVVPEASIAVAHGQMPKEQLEKVMLEFLGRAYDVLVATTIIESGLDIPNVNTIIINHAEDFGLSQMYQLRGRVGRSERQAYAYLFYPRGKSVSEVSEKRLSAIEEFTDLGSGFKVAMRDLEIRGVGNLLGSQQHGNVASVGFDLYCHLLNDAVSRLKGEEVEPDRTPRLELDLEAYVPDDFVPDPRAKMELYKRLSRLKNEDALEEIKDELQDRYGEPPSPMLALFEAVEIRLIAMQLGASEIVQKGNIIALRFWEDQEPKDGFVQHLLQKYADGKVRFLPGPPAGLSLQSRNGQALAALKAILPEILPYVTMGDQESALLAGS